MDMFCLWSCFRSCFCNRLLSLWLKLAICTAVRSCFKIYDVWSSVFDLLCCHFAKIYDECCHFGKIYDVYCNFAKYMMFAVILPKYKMFAVILQKYMMFAVIFKIYAVCCHFHNRWCLLSFHNIWCLLSFCKIDDVCCHFIRYHSTQRQMQLQRSPSHTDIHLTMVHSSIVITLHTNFNCHHITYQVQKLIHKLRYIAR